MKKSLIRSIKKLSPKPGNILVITLKGYPSDWDIMNIRDKLAAMPSLTGVFVLFINKSIFIRKEKPTQGKHKVYLNNLEYLEYLSKQKGE
jgi:maltose-binding protein MalE